MASEDSLKKTSLHAEHLSLKARLVDFGGWHMPIQYTSVIKEHEAVRSDCGVFDVSHMGEIFVSQAGALDFLQKITINDVSKLQIGGGQYTAMLNEQGGMIDDLILYRLGETHYLLCVNAANIEKDFSWIESQAKQIKKDLKISNDSDSWSQLAVQGPKSEGVISAVFDKVDADLLSNLEYMNIVELDWNDGKVLLARTGYTGEHGYEIYLPNKLARDCFQAVLKAGATPIGLGARDTLRLEASYLLYGNDMNDEVSPIEAGIGWATKVDKGDFIGKNRVLEDKDASNSRRRKMIGFLLQDKGIARAGMDIYSGDTRIGTVTSGSFLPSLKEAGGMALITKDAANLGDEISIDVRGKRKLAKVVKRPLYSPKVK